MEPMMVEIDDSECFPDEILETTGAITRVYIYDKSRVEIDSALRVYQLSFIRHITENPVNNDLREWLPAPSNSQLSVSGADSFGPKPLPVPSPNGVPLTCWEDVVQYYRRALS